MTPSDLQDRLTGYYELSLPLDVAAVVTSDVGWRNRILPEGARRPCEQLLLQQHEDGLDLALYLDADILQRLRSDDPRQRLHDGNLPSLAAALEGVSHFVCLAWHAQHEREISALELELQAEIDKFLGCAGLVGEHEGGRLLNRLFDQAAFDPDLDAEERSRYATAHRLAARYCLDLLRRHDGRLSGDRAQRELCRFYRLSRRDKFAMIG